MNIQLDREIMHPCANTSFRRYKRRKAKWAFCAALDSQDIDMTAMDAAKKDWMERNRSIVDWSTIRRSWREQQPLSGRIVEETVGGVLVNLANFKDVFAFLSRDQIWPGRVISNFRPLVGCELKGLITVCDARAGRIGLSRIALAERIGTVDDGLDIVLAENMEVLGEDNMTTKSVSDEWLAAAASSFATPTADPEGVKRMQEIARRGRETADRKYLKTEP